MSNEEFGKKIGVSHSMASRIRNGQRLPGTRTIHAIHREFGIELLALMNAHQDGPEAFGRLVATRLEELATA